MALTIYWDMDDVQAQWFEYVHKNYMTPRNLANFHTQVAGVLEFEDWYTNEVRNNELFLKLEPSPLMKTIMTLMLLNKSHGGKNRILTSLAGQSGSTSIIIMQEKLRWLDAQYGNTKDFFDDVVFVSKNTDKKYYCDSNTVLVDDHKGNIDEWSNRAVMYSLTAYAMPIVSHDFSRHYKMENNSEWFGFIQELIQDYPAR